MRLENKLTVITGAASGIGAAGAVLFAREGAAVALVDRDEAGMKAVAARIRDSGGTAHIVVADLGRYAAVVKSVADAAQLLGGIDAIWCNAGVAGPVEVEDLKPEDYERTVAINQTSAVVGSADAVPHMRRRGGGSIIITSSQSGLVGGVASPVYSATKAAVIGWTRSLALRVAMDGIRVNAICPGPSATPILEKAMREGAGGLSGEEYSDRITSGVPLGRVADPMEIAHAALWLASDESSFVTGIAMPVDGGYTCR
jgi:NAD(P)-dependent dehydrogenase (short-subunit alcohol dehydrogenase family)